MSKKYADVLSTIICDDNVRSLNPINIVYGKSAQYLVHLKGSRVQKRTSTRVEKNTDTARGIVCDNDIRFAVTGDVSCDQRDWISTGGVGVLENEYAVAEIEKNTDGISIKVWNDDIRSVIVIDVDGS